VAARRARLHRTTSPVVARAFEASRRGFEGNIYVILDIADPRSPKEVGMWFPPRAVRRLREESPPRTHLPAWTAVLPVVIAPDLARGRRSSILRPSRTSRTEARPRLEICAAFPA